jgi:hypothetical protein
MSKYICSLLFVLLFAVTAESRTAVEDQKIEFLVGSIAALKDATFIRNGNEYDSQRAVDHVRMKLRFAGNRVATAEDFITYCATGSSISGQPYKIRFSDGREITSSEFLHEKLSQFRPGFSPK